MGDSGGGAPPMAPPPLNLGGGMDGGGNPIQRMAASPGGSGVNSTAPNTIDNATNNTDELIKQAGPNISDQINKDQLDDLLNQINDQNGDGEINRDELENLLDQINDQNGDGQISKDELEDLLGQLDGTLDPEPDPNIQIYADFMAAVGTLESSGGLPNEALISNLRTDFSKVATNDNIEAFANQEIDYLAGDWYQLDQLFGNQLGGTGYNETDGEFGEVPTNLAQTIARAYNVANSIVKRCDLINYMVDQFQLPSTDGSMASMFAYMAAYMNRASYRYQLETVISAMQAFESTILADADPEAILDLDPNVEDKKRFAVDVITRFNTKVDVAFQIHDHMVANGMNPPDELGRIRTVEDGVFEGTDEMDIVLGGSGDDVIYGKGGNDLIFGGGGNDQIYGGDGNDVIYGGGGNDEIHDGAGDDVVYGGRGGDTIFEGEGVDQIYGGNGPQSLFDGFNPLDFQNILDSYGVPASIGDRIFDIVLTNIQLGDDPQSQISKIVSELATLLEGEGIVLNGGVENGADVSTVGIDYDAVVDDIVDMLVAIMEGNNGESTPPDTVDNAALLAFAAQLQNAPNFLPSDALVNELEFIGNNVDQDPFDAVDLAQQAADIRVHKSYVLQAVAVFGGDTSDSQAGSLDGASPILPEGPDAYEIGKDVLRHLDEIRGELAEAHMFLNSQEAPEEGTGYDIEQFLPASIQVGGFLNVLKAIEFVPLDRNEDIVVTEGVENEVTTRSLLGGGSGGGVRGRVREMIDNFLLDTFGTAFDAIAIVRRPDFTYSMLLELVPGGEEFLAQGQEFLADAFVYFQAKLAEHNLTSERVTNLYNEVLGNLSWWDIGTVALAGLTGGPGLFILAQRVFGDIIADATAFVADIAADAGQIILEAVLNGVDPSGNILTWLENAGQTIYKIYEDPSQFISNLTTAFRDGFVQFGLNFGDHLRESFFEWLFGEINAGTGGIQIPEQFDLGGIFSLTTQILDISWSGGANPIRTKVVNAVDRLGYDGEGIVSAGENIVSGATMAVQLMNQIQSEGIGVLWDQMVGQLTNFWDQVTGTIIVWARDQIIMKGAEQLIAKFIPGLGVLQAIRDIYNLVNEIISKLEELFELMDLVISALNKIVIGDTQEASDYIEMALGNGLTLSINFLAETLGLNVAQSIRSSLEYVRSTVNSAIDSGIDWLAGNLVEEDPNTPSTFDNPNEEFFLYDSDEELAAFIEANGIEEVRLGNETHHVEVHAEAVSGGVEADVGVASEWKSAKRIRDTIVQGAQEPDSEIAGREGEINGLYQPVETKLGNYNSLLETIRTLREEARAQGKSARSQWMNDLRTMETTQLNDLVAECRSFIAEAWLRFGDYLPVTLQPAGVMFQDRTDFSGDNSKLDKYHTGTQSDPIPIMWYKNPSEYPTVRYNGNDYAFGDALNINGTSFQVSSSNIPTDDLNYVVQKRSHFETRANQVKFNKTFNDAGVTINGKSNPLGNAGGFDGDHVKDLGFGGQDVADNYWPLIAEANRRAFNGYNAGYILNYVELEGTDRIPKSRVIGGLIGKWFVVKGFDSQNTPSESGTNSAGLLPADE